MNRLPLMPDAKRQEMLDAAKPLMKWMAENLHPHHQAVVENNRIQLFELVVSGGTDEFLRD